MVQSAKQLSRTGEIKKVGKCVGECSGEQYSLRRHPSPQFLYEDRRDWMLKRNFVESGGSQTEEVNGVQGIKPGNK